MLKAYASAKVRDAWLQRVLDLDLTGFINQVEVTDQAYWDVLSHAARTFLRAATPEVLSQVRADRKVKTWLVAQNRRAELIDFMDQRRHEGSHMRTEVIDGTVRALLPFHDDARLAVPRELYTLSDAETALVTSLRSFRATEDGALEIEGWAYIRYVDLSAREPTLRVWLVNDQGERRELAVHPFTSPAATRWGGHRYQSYDQGGFAARIDVAELAAPVPGDARGTAARWRVEVSVTVDGLERTGVISTATSEAARATCRRCQRERRGWCRSWWRARASSWRSASRTSSSTTSPSTTGRSAGHCGRSRPTRSPPWWPPAAPARPWRPG